MSISFTQDFSKSIGLIDADVVAYRVAFAMEKEPANDLEEEVSTYIGNLMALVGCERYILFLTGKNNFRLKSAVSKPYKGNRPSTKPTYLSDVRKVLLDKFNALLVEDYEADDAILSASTRYKNQSIVISIDKDLLQQPGWHFNFYHNKFIFMSDSDATKLLWKQVMTGDSTDNIPGLKGIGKAKAEKLLALDDVPAIACQKAYKEQLGSAYLPYFLEQIDLIRMRQDVELPYEEHILEFNQDEYKEIDYEKIKDLF